MAARTKPAYDPAKRYAVTLKRVVEHDGFTFKPGPEPIEMTGALANTHATAIAEARELEPEPEMPAPVEAVHEPAER